VDRGKRIDKTNVIVGVVGVAGVAGVVVVVVAVVVVTVDDKVADTTGVK
jgi:hypothetical protein